MAVVVWTLLSTFTVLVFVGNVSCYSFEYGIGVGRADITGPAADVNMMGYANAGQTTGGIHLRQFSRAFVIESLQTEERVLFLSIDACMATTVLKTEVLSKLRKLYGTRYTTENVCISATHTHSGPGGYHQYFLYSVTSLGFVKETFDSLVDGIVQSVKMAHESVQPGSIYHNEGELLGSNINRSPTSYLLNPESERDKYKYDVDKNMVLLKFVDAKNEPIGMISWFPVHCTSMQSSNKLISSDNKGYAAILFEQEMNPGQLPGEGKFVAAFAQANEGDTSPNTGGARCKDTGKSCDAVTSTCNGKSNLCVGTGPGKDMFESTKIIAEKQFKKAKEIFDKSSKKLTGPVEFVHQNVDMTNQFVQLKDGTGMTVKTCKPALGFSFAAGATDGPGGFGFKQGDTSGNPLWEAVAYTIKKPSNEQVACHKPKPILLSTGEMTFPWQWQPSVVETQIFRIGKFFMVSLPGEFTTMAGRRVRESVYQTLKNDDEDSTVVLAGLSNSYSGYVTTFEEYQAQRYEAASTIYGPHTLQAYIQQYEELANKLSKGESVEQGPQLPNLLDRQWSFLPPVILDSVPFWKRFGDVINDARRYYSRGSSVEVSFWTGNPRNDRRPGGTFLKVQHRQRDGSWKTVYTDSNWCTKYKWKRTNILFGQSKAFIHWDIPSSQTPGTYRIKHYCDAKSIFGRVKSYTGKTRSFRVTR